MTLKTRLGRLEGKQADTGLDLDMIVITLVEPGADGPVNLGPYAAHILKGPNAGLQIQRDDAESVEAFEVRCNALLEA